MTSETRKSMSKCTNRLEGRNPSLHPKLDHVSERKELVWKLKEDGDVVENKGTH